MNYKSFRSDTFGEQSGLKELMVYAHTGVGWFRPYFIDETDRFFMQHTHERYTSIFARVDIGWTTLDGTVVVSNPSHVRRIDRLVAADSIRKRLLSDPETNRSRIARFRVGYVLHLNDPHDPRPIASLYAAWRRCLRLENRDRRRQVRELLGFKELVAEDFDKPPSAKMFHHLERNPRLIPNIALLKPQIKWPNEIYSNALVNGLRTARPAMEAAAEARSVATELLR